MRKSFHYLEFLPLSVFSQDIAHLSRQFKKVTGLTPSHYKALKEKRRITIQSI